MENQNRFNRFLEEWRHLTPSQRQCFVDLNGLARCWNGSQDRFGDSPGRSFGFSSVFLALTTPEERKVLRRRLEDLIRKDDRALGDALSIIY